MGDDGAMIWTIPNILTTYRMIAAPCVALVFLIFDHPLADWLALGLFLSAAITDFFDGWLARKLNQISEIGKMLDPIADKAMVIIALMVLLSGKAVMTPTGLRVDITADFIMVPAVIIIMREVMISGLREFLGDVKLRTTQLAKYKTTVQMIAIGLLLFALACGREVNPVWTSAETTVLFQSPADAFFWRLSQWMSIAGIAALWLAAVLTIITGWDYFRKGLAYIRRREQDTEAFK